MWAGEGAVLQAWVPFVEGAGEEINDGLTEISDTLRFALTLQRTFR